MTTFHKSTHSERKLHRKRLGFRNPLDADFFRNRWTWDIRSESVGRKGRLNWFIWTRVGWNFGQWPSHSDHPTMLFSAHWFGLEMERLMRLS